MGLLDERNCKLDMLSPAEKKAVVSALDICAKCSKGRDVEKDAIAAKRHIKSGKVSLTDVAVAAASIESIFKVLDDGADSNMRLLLKQQLTMMGELKSALKKLNSLM